MDETPSWAAEEPQSTPDWAADSESLTPHTDQALKEPIVPATLQMSQSREATRPKVEWSSPVGQRISAFIHGAGVPSSWDEARQFITRSPIQDVKDIATDVAKIPERVRNFGQTISTSPAATVVKAPLSPEAFGVYGTIAAMLAPGMLEKLKGEPDASGITSTESVPEPEVRPQVGEEAPLRQQGETADAQEPVPDASTVAAEVQTGADAPGAGTGEIAPSLQNLLDQYDEGDEKIQTVRDLVNQVEEHHGDNPDAMAAVEKYREDQRENMEEFGGRGDEDQIESEFLNSIKKTAKATPVPAAEETPAVAEQPKPEEVGTNVKGFEKIYGAGEIPAGGSITPEEAWDIASERAATGKADPYGIVDRARTGAITPDEMGDLIYEHQRLVNEAAAAEGTPQYEELYQRARTFARNVVKPAENAAFHRTGMVMQIKAPIDYSNLTGFRAALEKRMGREMLPEEMPAFKKIVDEVNGAKKARNGAASEAMGKAINRFKGVKDISFEDAVKQIHDSLEEAAKPCKL